jgi:hypothetical protein
MFCPQCSLPQYSNDVRFCQRCGFHLGAVSQLMVTNGIQTQPQQWQAQSQGLSLGRFRNAPIGAKLMFFGLALFPFAMMASIGADSPGPLGLPVIIFLIGLIQVLYVWLFGTKRANMQHSPQPEIMAAQNRPAAMPYSETPPLRIEDRRDPNTSEIIRPASVTEHTTKLLDR